MTAPATPTPTGGPVPAGPGQTSPVPAGPGQAGPTLTGGPGQAGPGQAGPGQAGTEQARPGQAGTGQVVALRAALAAEHAVVWGYGVVGGRAGEDLLARVREADSAHRTRRDAVVALVVRYGGEPVPTEPEYALPFPVTDRRTALRLAVHLEDGAAAAWRYAVAATDDRAVRRTALAALADAAVRATRWRLLLPTTPATVPFPGDPA